MSESKKTVYFRIKPYLNNKDSVDTPNRKAFLSRQDSDEKKERSKVLGKGSFGVVLTATYKGQAVAVKITNKTLSSVPGEQNILQVSHKNIVKVFTIVEESTYSLIIMEQIVGQNLNVLMNHVSLDLQKRLMIIEQVAIGLKFCHSIGLLHLDIKPNNIMVCVGGPLGFKVKLCDFGNSKRLPANQTSMSVKHICGTIIYMAPELLQKKIVSPATDIYALAITMWELENGKVPYCENGKAEDIIYMVVRKNLRPDSKMPHMSSNISSDTFLVSDKCPLGKTFVKINTSDFISKRTYNIRDDLDSRRLAAENEIDLNFEEPPTFKWGDVFKPEKNNCEAFPVVESYRKLYRKCWNPNPCHRPEITCLLELVSYYLLLMK